MDFDWSDFCFFIKLLGEFGSIKIRISLKIITVLPCDRIIVKHKRGYEYGSAKRCEADLIFNGVGVSK